MSKINDEINFIPQNKKVEMLFGIKSEEYWYNRNMKHFIPIEGMSNINKCELINKDELFLFLKQKFSKYCLNNYEIYVSDEPVYTSDVKDYFGKNVFMQEEDCKGWLVFIDQFSDANWSHTCQYWHVVNKFNILQMNDEKWPPSKSLKMEKLDIKEWGVN